MRIISDRDGRLHAAPLRTSALLRDPSLSAHTSSKQTLPLYITRLQTHRTQSSMSVPRTFHQ